MKAVTLNAFTLLSTHSGTCMQFETMLLSKTEAQWCCFELNC